MRNFYKKIQQNLTVRFLEKLTNTRPENACTIGLCTFIFVKNRRRKKQSFWNVDISKIHALSDPHILWVFFFVQIKENQLNGPCPKVQNSEPP